MASAPVTKAPAAKTNRYAPDVMISGAETMSAPIMIGAAPDATIAAIKGFLGSLMSTF
jgi:hypothetical protein